MRNTIQPFHALPTLRLSTLSGHRSVELWRSPVSSARRRTTRDAPSVNFRSKRLPAAFRRSISGAFSAMWPPAATGRMAALLMFDSTTDSKRILS